MTASLAHANPILSAAISAGFRESGVQSLKNTYDPSACPMVAVRSAGLGVEATIGSVASRANGSSELLYMVSRSYRDLLVRLANERFKANTERMERFLQALKQAEHPRRVAYEDPEVRQARKRQEGLERAAKIQSQRSGEIPDPLSEPLDIDALEDVTSSAPVP